MRSVKCGVESGECGVECVECAECVKCKVWSVKCGV